MARAFSGTTQFLSAASAAVTTTPLTLSCWFLPNDLTTAQALMNVSVSSGTNHFALVYVGTAAGLVRAQTSSGGSAANADTSAGSNTSVWAHACGVFTSATSRAAFLNGGSKGTNATSKTPSGTINQTNVGRFVTALQYFTGNIAEVAMWNAALADAEVLALSSGISPFLVRNASLVGYWPLWGIHSPEIDLDNGRTLTVTGATAANHAPVRPFTRLERVRLPQALVLPASLPAGTLGPAGYRSPVRIRDQIDF